MTLVRVYCGLASADSSAAATARLTVSVVDDAGRLLDTCEVGDDAGGYAELSALFAQRGGGPGGVAVATADEESVVIRLLAAAGGYVSYTDEDSADDYAERFADDGSADEIRGGPAERRAVGLARALQAGVLSAVPQAPPRELISIKPLLAAHAAMVTGRQHAAGTLREVLRELYPAALRAYADPAEPVSLAVLEALPEAGQLGTGTGGRSREDQVVSTLVEAGVAEKSALSEAVTALRVAVAETPRRAGLSRAVTSAVAETVRQAVSSVRCCDAATEALIGTIADRVGGPVTMGRAERSEPAAPAPLRVVAGNAATTAVTAESGPARAAGRSRAARPEGSPSEQVPAAKAEPAAGGRRARPAEAPTPVSLPAQPVAVSAPPAQPVPLHTPLVQPVPLQSSPAARRPPPTSPALPTAPIQPASPHVAPANPASPLQPAAAASAPVAAPAVRPPGEPTRSERRAAEIAATAPAPSAAPAAPSRTTIPPSSRQSRPVAPPEPTEQVDAPRPPAYQPVEPGPFEPTIYQAGRGDHDPYRSGSFPATGLGPASAQLPPTRRAPEAEPAAARRAPEAELPQTRRAPEAEPPATRRPSGSVQPAAAHHSPSGQFGQITYGTPARGADPITHAPGPRLSPEVPAPGSRASWPVAGASDGVDPPHSAPPAVEQPAARSGLPLAGLGAHLTGIGGTVTAAAAGGGGAAEVPRPVDLPRQREGRVVPPWQSDDLPAEPPTLRLVEPAPLADPALSISPGPADDLGADLRYDPPTLRLVEPDRQEQAPRRRRMSVDEPVDPPAENGADDSDLLIFSACQSAWFTDGEEEEEQLDWGTAADRGWEAAELAARPAVGAETGAGLPRRVPQQNLVPGSPLPPAEERPLRIVRDAASIAAHTSGYFRGYRRGQEVGGYSVGGRPGRESVGGWDFSREASIGEDEYPSGDYEYRSAR